MGDRTAPVKGFAQNRLLQTRLTPLLPPPRFRSMWVLHNSEGKHDAEHKTAPAATLQKDNL